MAKLKRIGNPRALGELTYETLKGAIISGQFPPGNWLSEDQLTKALGVSRTPIREAFKQLQSEGLIEIFPRKGAYIVPLTEADITNLFEVRIVLETAFFNRSARRISRDKLKRFRAKFEEAERDMLDSEDDLALLVSKWRDYLKVDRSFHDELLKASENPYWLRLYLNIRDRMQVFGYKMWRMPEQREVLSEQHRAVLNALMERKYPKAKKRLTEHLEYVRDVFLKTI